MKIMKENEKLNAVVFPSMLSMRFMVKKKIYQKVKR